MGGGIDGDKNYNDAIDKERETAPGYRPTIPEWLSVAGRTVITRDGLECVKHFESLFLKAYRDPVGVVTIAYGRIKRSDGSSVEMGDTCTEAEADAWLMEDLEREAAHYVRTWLKRSLAPHEWSALVSFTFNRGAGRFKEKLCGLVNQGEMQAAADCILTYDWAGKDRKVLAGLTRRRKAEVEMFLGRDWTKYKA